MEQVKDMRSHGLPTVPSILAEELSLQSFSAPGKPRHTRAIGADGCSNVCGFAELEGARKDAVLDNAKKRFALILMSMFCVFCSALPLAGKQLCLHRCLAAFQALPEFCRSERIPKFSAAISSHVKRLGKNLSLSTASSYFIPAAARGIYRTNTMIKIV
jgi:hypothetical protein